MALFSDIDWLIIAAVAVFLLFGKDNAQLLRTFGRYYARAIHLKQELLGELSKELEIAGSPGPTTSLRGALLGLDSSSSAASGIPTAVRVPPPAPYSPPVQPTFPWTGGYPVPTWSTTVAPTGAWGEVSH